MADYTYDTFQKEFDEKIKAVEQTLTGLGRTIVDLRRDMDVKLKLARESEVVKVIKSFEGRLQKIEEQQGRIVKTVFPGNVSTSPSTPTPTPTVPTPTVPTPTVPTPTVPVIPDPIPTPPTPSDPPVNPNKP